MNLLLMENLIRSVLGESSNKRLIQSRIYAALNDGYKDVASKAFCIEHIDKISIGIGERYVGFSGYRINKVGYLVGSDEGRYVFTDGDYTFTDDDYTFNRDSLYLSSHYIGIEQVVSEALGHLVHSLDTYPRFWFQWGNYLVVDPVPDVAYVLEVFISDYPTAQLSLSTDTLSDLPFEFEYSVIDFALYSLAIHLRKWNQAAINYNTYITNLAKHKTQYMERTKENKGVQLLPDNVALVRPQAVAQ